MRISVGGPGMALKIGTNMSQVIYHAQNWVLWGLCEGLSRNAISSSEWGSSLETVNHVALILCIWHSRIVNEFSMSQGLLYHMNDMADPSSICYKVLPRIYSRLKTQATTMFVWPSSFSRYVAWALTPRLTYVANQVAQYVCLDILNSFIHRLLKEACCQRSGASWDIKGQWLAW